MKTDGTNPPGQEIKGLIDINCHILPGMEDGPDDLREAAEMLRIAYDEGIRHRHITRRIQSWMVTNWTGSWSSLT